MTEDVGQGSSDSDSSPEDGDLVPYRVLDTANRRTAGGVYLVAAGVAGGVVVATGISLMWLTAVLPLLGIALYQFVSGRPLETSDMEAIDIASNAAPFDVGHGSATLGFAGFTAKPVWQVLVFEAGTTPRHQALVTVDALTGEVAGSYSEPVDPV